MHDRKTEHHGAGCDYCRILDELEASLPLPHPRKKRYSKPTLTVYGTLDQISRLRKKVLPRGGK